MNDMRVPNLVSEYISTGRRHVGEKIQNPRMVCTLRGTVQYMARVCATSCDWAINNWLERVQKAVVVAKLRALSHFYLGGLMKNTSVGISGTPDEIRTQHLIESVVQVKTVTTCVKPLKPSGHYMYHQFNSQQFYVLPTQCIYVFCVDLRTNSDYFPKQH